MLEAWLIGRDSHYSSSLMDKTNRKSPFWMSSGLEGFVEEVGLELG